MQNSQIDPPEEITFDAGEPLGLSAYDLSEWHIARTLNRAARGQTSVRMDVHDLDCVPLNVNCGGKDYLDQLWWRLESVESVGRRRVATYAKECW